MISSGAAFVACALQGVAGGWRGGVPLKTRGVIFERVSVFSVFRGRCRSARLRVRRVCAKMNVERVGVKNAACAAQLEDFEAMATVDVVRYYIIVVAYTSRKEFVKRIESRAR